MNYCKRLGKLIVFCLLLTVLLVGGINLYVIRVGANFLSQSPKQAETVIVLGASVYGNTVSALLAQRLDTAYELYQKGYAKNIIVSGDHGTKDYNEVNAMKTYLLEKGVPPEDIFMDHAGFSTYDTVYRAKEVFMVKDALIVSQTEHLYRALYVAKELGLEATGVSAGEYGETLRKTQSVREIFARVKAFLQCEILHPEPEFLGDPIPVSKSDGRITEG